MEYDRDAILTRMLAAVPDDIDKREGSIIYNTLAPTATALAESYYMFAFMQNLMYADTAEGDWLDRVCSDFGIDREKATKAVRQINTFNESGQAVDIPLGSRFAIEDVTFLLSEKLATGQYKAVCEQAGIRGNFYSGAILPVDNINGLGSAVLISAPLIPARDKESDESLYARLYISTRQKPYGGNISDYEQKVLAIDGVGAVKVFNAVEMGAGKVGIVIGDEQGNTATPTLVDKVQQLIGVDGTGIAPIGHTVTVMTSTDLTINIVAEIKLKTGASFEIVKPVVTLAIQDYINGVAFTDPTVFYAKLVATVLNAHEAILDVGTVTMNGVSANIALEKTYTTYQVPVIGTVTVTEVV